MNLEKYDSYSDSQKYILGILYRMGAEERKNMQNIASRLVCDFKSVSVHDVEEFKLDFLIEDRWCIEEEGSLILSNEIKNSQLDEKIWEDRERLRRRMNDSVCAHVELDPEHPVRKSLFEIDRADFVHPERRPYADIDCPQILKEGMTESALHAVLMTIQAVNPVKNDRVLICGIKGGYLCALISDLVGNKGAVIGLDWDEEIAQNVELSLQKYPDAAKNTIVFCQDDVTQGLNEKAPFDIIIVNGCIPQVPLTLMAQLHETNGRILFYLHSGGNSSACYLIKKNEKVLNETRLNNFKFTPIPGHQGFVGITNLQKQYDEGRQMLLDAQDDLAEINRRIPYPLAKMLWAAHNARHPSECLKAGLKIGEVLTRILAFICINRFDELNLRDEKISEVLNKIYTNPTNGDWSKIIRLSLINLKKDELGGIIQSDYEKALRLPQVLKLCQQIDDFFGKPKRGNAHIKLSEFLDLLSTFRNKAEAHGGMLSESESKMYSDLMLKSFLQIVRDISIFKTYTLLDVHEQKLTYDGRKMELEVYYLNGVQIVRELIILEKNEAENWKPGVCLIKDKKNVVSLTPWMIMTDEGRSKVLDVFLYNGKDEYITYYNHHKYPDKQYQNLMTELISRHPLPPKAKIDLDIIKPILMALMPVFTADGIINRSELEILTTAVMSASKLTEEECQQLLIDLITQEYPNAYIER